MSIFTRSPTASLFAPWDKAAVHAPAEQQIALLFDREEGCRTRPFGHVLDLRCGTGHWSTELAHLGWSVTGIDLVVRAVATARHEPSRDRRCILILAAHGRCPV